MKNLNLKVQSGTKTTSFLYSWLTNSNKKGLQRPEFDIKQVPEDKEKAKNRRSAAAIRAEYKITEWLKMLNEAEDPILNISILDNQSNSPLNLDLWKSNKQALMLESNPSLC